mmetsp:Transcript_32619/g.55895  ORF Transcript_32619/g.55895 Transcript_32619/m.55895 type:complete len:86 (-) Transcript_32619:318-575(-)
MVLDRDGVERNIEGWALYRRSFEKLVARLSSGSGKGALILLVFIGMAFAVFFYGGFGEASQNNSKGNGSQRWWEWCGPQGKERRR